MKVQWLLVIPIIVTLGWALYPTSQQESARSNGKEKRLMNDIKDQAIQDKVVKTDEEWRKTLTPEQYYILRQKGTERAFTGEYWNLKDDGSYTCAGCGTVLFTSDTKFDSHCGWPSFFDAVDKDKIEYKDDFSHGMHRIEVMCKKCGGHLGHVFDDGPNPTGQRYCINSAALKFKKDEKPEAKKADEKQPDEKK